MKLAEEWTDIREEETGSMAPQMELPEILEDVKGFLSRYILFSKEAQAIVVTLWVAHTLVMRRSIIPPTSRSHPRSNDAAKAGSLTA
jgi:hypothetical protein